MRFVDEAKITVIAGNGGDGFLSFRREKFIPRGGPDGGDGGDGGSIYLVVDTGLNTLVDFRHKKIFRGGHGQSGRGKECHGKGGEDLIIYVPLGTLVKDMETDEIIGDMTTMDKPLLVAQGGWHGLGNIRFKSSKNRTPRQTSKGVLGETRTLFLEMQLLADIGLLGTPNVGKSSFIRAVSQVRPKVSAYPFTTLHPHLGVVKIAVDQSFVMADIPGLIKGAAKGVGLGISFLKHLSRTRLLLHLVDIGQLNYDMEKCIRDIQLIDEELQEFDQGLAEKPKWVVLNKIDLIDEKKIATCKAQLEKKLPTETSIFFVSAVTGKGCNFVVQSAYQWLEKNKIDDMREDM